MSDQYSGIRSLPFSAVCQALGLDFGQFKSHKGGQELQGYCHIHKPKNNKSSFCWNVESGVWRCFACPAKGKGAIDYAMAVRQCGFQQAVEALQPFANAPRLPTPAPTEKTPPGVNSDVLEPLKKDTWSKFQVPCEWLEKRVPDKAIRERYGVFCYNNPARKSAYSGKIMLPIRDVEGTLYGYLARDISGNPDASKYLFPRNLPKSHFLFGAAELKSSQHLPVKVVYVVESPLCVMKFASLGFPSVAAYGWSVSDEQIQILQRLAKGIVYLCDRNKYQERGSVLASIATAMWVKAPPLPEHCQDPETLTRDEILALTK